ncbi:SEL1-like repeat protein [Helicobacter cetorum]|uniref:Uncharacterized protein n=1 Tax=Helicobacter cetorum (strain ATCC BAA-540 / CCUG 52418 / MIT 99-5656) TaxID=1163745 RepID=I0EQD5_HELCM|nr:hypothetical protein [Helicobacter cetorum]AFI05154.1 hypothetical protein HCD_00610 [Helicobacter cetorum MIT 99-5656]
MANIFRDGCESIGQNSEKCFKHSLKAIELGDTSLYGSLADMYFEGRETEQNFQKSV